MGAYRSGPLLSGTVTLALYCIRGPASERIGQAGDGPVQSMGSGYNERQGHRANDVV